MFTVKPGTAYQAAFLMPGLTENPAMGSGVGSGLDREVGTFQVSLYYPLKAGAGVAEAKAETIRLHFPRGLVLLSGNVRLVIASTPSVAQGRPDMGFYIVPVSIFYWADVNK